MEGEAFFQIGLVRTQYLFWQKTQHGKNTHLSNKL